jgi:hypothetical protein
MVDIDGLITTLAAIAEPNTVRAFAILRDMNDVDRVKHIMVSSNLQ